MHTVKKRDWKKVNESYVKRGEFLINPKFLHSWLKEIDKMNKDKVGQPYLYPDSMIEFMGHFHCKGFNYRECEGILKGISKNYKYSFPTISYSQICRRLNRLEIDFEFAEENVIVGSDGTGEKVSNRGEWMRNKWKVRRGWIKVVILGDEDGNVRDIRVGSEKMDERKSTRGMIRNNHKNIKRVYCDGLHDCRDTFNLCEKHNIETAIKVRKGSSTKPKNSPRRKQEVIKYQKLSHDEWVKKTDYGKRWLCSEGIFSAKKRIMGERVVAKKKRNMYHEVKLQYYFYNKLKDAGG